MVSDDDRGETFPADVGTGMHVRCYDIIVDAHQTFEGVDLLDSTVISNGPARFRFSHLSRDGFTAVFKAESHHLACSMVFRRLLEKSIIGGPMFCITLYQVANDTGMDNLQINSELFEISFDWSSMFTQLLGEESVFKMFFYEQESVGKTNEPEKPWALKNNPEQDCRRKARRSRLRRKCQAELGSYILDDYIVEEESALEQYRGKESLLMDTSNLDILDEERRDGDLWNQHRGRQRAKDRESRFGRLGIPKELRNGRPSYRYQGPKLTFLQRRVAVDHTRRNAIRRTSAGAKADSEPDALVVGPQRPSNLSENSQEPSSIAAPQYTQAETQAGSSTPNPPCASTSSQKRPPTDTHDQIPPPKRRPLDNPHASLAPQPAVFDAGPAQDRPKGTSALVPSADLDASIAGSEALLRLRPNNA